MYIVTKFGANWFIFVDASRIQQFFPIQEQITQVVPVQFYP